jgi:hypothetical protein
MAESVSACTITVVHTSMKLSLQSIAITQTVKSVAVAVASISSLTLVVSYSWNKCGTSVCVIASMMFILQPL